MGSKGCHVRDDFLRFKACLFIVLGYGQLRE